MGACADLARATLPSAPGHVNGSFVARIGDRNAHFECGERFKIRHMLELATSGFRRGLGTQTPRIASRSALAHRESLLGQQAGGRALARVPKMGRRRDGKRHCGGVPSITLRPTEPLFESHFASDAQARWGVLPMSEMDLAALARGLH